MDYSSYSYDDYRCAMKLFKRGLGLTETCKWLPKTRKSTLYYWRHGIYKPPMVRWVPEPSNELAYVIGVLNGDGYVIREHGYNYDIELLVKDHEFVGTFSKFLTRILVKKYKEPYWSKSNNRWRVYYSSKALHTWFRQQTLETLKPYIEYSRDTVVYFIRGLYGSEGYNYSVDKISI